MPLTVDRLRSDGEAWDRFVRSFRRDRIPRVPEADRHGGLPPHAPLPRCERGRRVREPPPLRGRGLLTGRVLSTLCGVRRSFADPAARTRSSPVHEMAEQRGADVEPGTCSARSPSSSRLLRDVHQADRPIRREFHCPLTKEAPAAGGSGRFESRTGWEALAAFHSSTWKSAAAGLSPVLPTTLRGDPRRVRQAGSDDLAAP
jgi:hypothetical protein